MDKQLVLRNKLTTSNIQIIIFLLLFFTYPTHTHIAIEFNTVSAAVRIFCWTYYIFRSGCNFWQYESNCIFLCFISHLNTKINTHTPHTTQLAPVLCAMQSAYRKYSHLSLWQRHSWIVRHVIEAVSHILTHDYHSLISEVIQNNKTKHTELTFRLKCCWSWSVQLDQPQPTALLPSCSNGKPEAATAVELLIMGMRMPEHVELYLNHKQ